MANRPNSRDAGRNRRAVFEKSLALSLGLFLLLFLSWQSVEIKAFSGISDQEKITVIDIPETNQEKQLKPPQERPSVPVETEQEVVPEEVDFVKTEFDPDDGELPPPPPPVEAEIVPFWSLEEPPELIHFSPPYYPELAQKAGLECDVFVKVLVDTEGKVSKVEIISPCGKAGFNEAAVEAAWKCVFTPGKQNEKAVRVWVSIPFQFRLR